MEPALQDDARTHHKTFPSWRNSGSWDKEVAGQKKAPEPWGLEEIQGHDQNQEVSKDWPLFCALRSRTFSVIVKSLVDNEHRGRATHT